MKRNSLISIFLIISMLTAVQITFGQYGTIKFCLNTPAWIANKTLMENKNEMFNEYAKGPEGCWWLKIAKHSSYKEWYYQFSMSGTQYYYNRKKNFWENGNRTACVESPFGK